MSEKTVIGTTTCGVCDFTEVPVRVMKSNRAYYCCPECDVQVYTRSRAGDSKLRAKTRPLPTATPPAPAAKPTPTNATKPAPAAKPAAPRGALDF